MGDSRGSQGAKNYLAHYASENYDPAKAHEYYVQNRDLKGGSMTTRNQEGVKESKEARQARVDGNQNRVQAWSYARKQIGDKKQAELKGLQEEQKARLETLRKNVEERRAQIREKLDALLENLKLNIKVEVKPVVKPNLNKIPENASPKVRAFLQEQNAKMMDTYNDKVRKNESEARKQTASNRKAAGDASKSARESASSEVRKLGEDLKAAVTNARAAYIVAKDQSIAKFKATSDTEQENIRTQVQ
jgi:hypothetical protein